MEEVVVNMGGVKFVTQSHTRFNRTVSNYSLHLGDRVMLISEENAQRLIAMDDQTREFMGLMISGFSRDLSQQAVATLQSNLRTLLGIDPLEERLDYAERNINRLDPNGF